MLSSFLLWGEPLGKAHIHTLDLGKNCMEDDTQTWRFGADTFPFQRSDFQVLYSFSGECTIPSLVDRAQRYSLFCWGWLNNLDLKKTHAFFLSAAHLATSPKQMLSEDTDNSRHLVICFVARLLRHTPWKTNISPENWWLEDEISV